MRLYSNLVFAESKALKQMHSWLRNCFSSVAIGKKSADRNPQLWLREVYYKSDNTYRPEID
ncbi:MAG: hypothetical protein GQ529_07200 [Methyloprofundus sp.]|nr:hypothetical protein [Methyloprofundus sp.]